MQNEARALTRKPHASGSETRQKQKRVTVRLTAWEHTAFAANAAKAGLTIPSYIREAGIYAPQTKSRERRTVDAEASMKLTAAMNRAGNLLNQAIKYVHFGNSPLLQEYKDALAILNDAIAAVLRVYERGKV